MALGARANLAENFAAAETAYRAALALQQKALGHDNPDTVTALMHLALQVSDQGRFAEADALFQQADDAGAARQRQGGGGAPAALRGAACTEPGPQASRRWPCSTEAENSLHRRWCRATACRRCRRRRVCSRPRPASILATAEPAADDRSDRAVGADRPDRGAPLPRDRAAPAWPAGRERGRHRLGARRWRAPTR